MNNLCYRRPKIAFIQGRRRSLSTQCSLVYHWRSEMCSTASNCAASNSGGAQASSKASSSQSSPAASKGALNANGPSLDGFDGQMVVFSKADQIVLQSGR